MMTGTVGSGANAYRALVNSEIRTVVRTSATTFKYAYENEPIHLDFVGLNYASSQLVGIFNMWGV